MYVTERGSCGYHGISSLLSDELDKQKLQNIKYVAISGHHFDRYYISKTNGKSMWSSDFPPVLRETLMDKGSLATQIAFGPDDSYFVQFQDGSMEWCGDIDPKAKSLFNARGVTVLNVWLGRQGAYFVAYLQQGVHKMSYKRVPKQVMKELSAKGRRVTQVLVDYDSKESSNGYGYGYEEDAEALTYFVRYT